MCAPPRPPVLELAVGNVLLSLREAGGSVTRKEGHLEQEVLAEAIVIIAGSSFCAWGPGSLFVKSYPAAAWPVSQESPRNAQGSSPADRANLWPAPTLRGPGEASTRTSLTRPEAGSSHCLTLACAFSSHLSSCPQVCQVLQ